MDTQMRLLITTLFIAGSVSTASASGGGGKEGDDKGSGSGVISHISASGLGMGTFSSSLGLRKGGKGDDGGHHSGKGDDGGHHSGKLELWKTFDSVNPIILDFTVKGGDDDEGGGGPYTITEHITNNTGVNWTDYHLTITDGNGTVFTGSSTLAGFQLYGSDSGHLNFLGALAAGQSADLVFRINPFNPGEDHTGHFYLTQVPTIPEPEAYAMFLAGLGLMGFMARRRSKTS